MQHSRALVRWSVTAVPATVRCPAEVHELELVGDLAGQAHLVGDDDHRHALLRDHPHDVEHLADEFRVEGRAGLVEEHQLRLHRRQRPRDRDPLLLATGQLRRVGLLLVGEADPLEQRAPRPAASCLETFLTRVGASMVFSSAVMCGNRLKW